LSKDDARLAGHPAARALIIGGDLIADSDEAQDLLPRVAQLPDTTTPVGSWFATAMTGALNYMGPVEQLHRPLHVPDQVTDFHKACRGDDAQPVGGHNNGTNCPATMLQGMTCSAKCNSGAAANGTFVCLEGKVRLTSVCAGQPHEGSVTLGRKVLFTLVTMATECPSPEQLHAILASALGVDRNIVEDVFCETSENGVHLAGQTPVQAVRIGGELNPHGAEAQDLLEKVKQLPDRMTSVGTLFVTALWALVGYRGSIEQLHVPLLLPDQVIDFEEAPVHTTTGSVPPPPPPLDRSTEATGLASGYLAALLVAAPLALGMLCVVITWAISRRRETGKKDESEWHEWSAV